MNANVKKSTNSICDIMKFLFNVEPIVNAVVKITIVNLVIGIEYALFLKERSLPVIKYIIPRGIA